LFFLDLQLWYLHFSLALPYGENILKFFPETTQPFKKKIGWNVP
jgi:hypothetical protein